MDFLIMTNRWILRHHLGKIYKPQVIKQEYIAKWHPMGISGR